MHSLARGVACALALAVPCPRAADGQAGNVAVDTAFRVPLGGVEQYVEIRAAARDLPVLLYLHGGPCMPATPFLRYYQAELAEDFIVVSWDQRGCGRSALVEARPPGMTLEQHVLDAHELTGYLKRRFGVGRIFLVGHSWGSVLGLELAYRYPEDYAAYVGVGQVVNVRRGDALARRELQARATARGDTATLRALDAIRVTIDGDYVDGLRGFLAHRRLLWMYGMMDHDPAAMLRAIEAAEGYSTDIADWTASAMYAQQALYADLVAVDLAERTVFEVPVFIFAGRYDFNTPGELAAAWLDAINAPLTGMVWFEASGHSPPWEQPAAFRARLLEVRDRVAETGRGSWKPPPRFGSGTRQPA